MSLHKSPELRKSALERLYLKQPQDPLPSTSPVPTTTAALTTTTTTSPGMSSPTAITTSPRPPEPRPKRTRKKRKPLQIYSTIVSYVESCVESPFEMRYIDSRNRKRRNHTLFRKLDDTQSNARLFLLILNLLIFLSTFFVIVPCWYVYNMLDQRHPTNYRLIVKLDIPSNVFFPMMYNGQMAILSLCGALGSGCEFGTCLITYGIVMASMVVIAGAGKYYFAQVEHQLKDDFKTEFDFAVINHRVDERYLKALQFVQKHLHCCGWEDGLKTYDDVMPSSCCATRRTWLNPHNATSWKQYCTKKHLTLHHGCSEFEQLNYWIKWLNFYLIMNACLQLCAAIAAIYLGRSFKYMIGD